jgi:hypothetical protein
MLTMASVLAAILEAAHRLGAKITQDSPGIG